MAIKHIRIVLVVAVMLAITAAFAYQYGLFAPTGSGGGGMAKIGGPFTLIDQHGKERRSSEFRGKLMLVFFGFTYCPDACPTTLQIISVALNTLGKQVQDVQPILITIDPERDDVAQLKSYVSNFHPRLIALTGSKQAIAAAARAYKVYYAKAAGQAEDGNYLMDHTSIIYLMGRDGSYLSHFTHKTKPEAMAATIRRQL
ncbi:MAG: SCO family protein [Alphaproteobacteria bacterium]